MIRAEFDKFALGGECDGYTHAMSVGKVLLPILNPGFWYVAIVGTGEAEVTVVPAGLLGNETYEPKRARYSQADSPYSRAQSAGGGLKERWY